MPTQQNWAVFGQGCVRGESTSQWEAVQRLTEGATIQKREGKGTPGGEGISESLLGDITQWHHGEPQGQKGYRDVWSYNHKAGS